MQIKIIFDKGTKNDKLQTGWGIAFLVNGKILFDTGEKGKWLISNMSVLGVDINELQAVVISHDHWDHTRGLWELLKRKENLTVYGCPSFSRDFKEIVNSSGGNLIESKGLTEIMENIFVTGEIPGSYNGGYMPEQALLLKSKRGLTVMTGCAHPGIIKILEKVKEDFPQEKIYLVFGGFHLMGKEKPEIQLIVGRFREMGIENVGPTHCTGYQAEKLFKEKYKEAYFSIKVGETFEI